MGKNIIKHQDTPQAVPIQELGPSRIAPPCLFDHTIDILHGSFDVGDMPADSGCMAMPL